MLLGMSIDARAGVALSAGLLTLSEVGGASAAKFESAMLPD